MATVRVKNSEGAWQRISAIKGDPGDQGDPGPGVPAGGAIGSFLRKLSAADLDTEWKDVLPVNNGGTGAMSAAAALTALGALGSPTLLWTNASASSTFAQQSIGGEWSAYTAFLVEYFVYTAQTAHRCIALIPKGVEMSPFHYLGAYGTNYWRYIVINNTGVLFYGGYYRADGGSAVADDLKMVPYKVFGLKGVSL